MPPDWLLSKPPSALGTGTLLPEPYPGSLSMLEEGTPISIISGAVSANHSPKCSGFEYKACVDLTSVWGG